MARAGHEVLVLERDRLEPGPDAESAAAAAFRAMAPQIVQPHIVMAKCRQLLLQWLPDVYDALLAAGVAEAPISTQMPASLVDKAEWPGDERLTMLMSRRSTIDWILQQAVLAEPRVTMLSGRRVLGLLATPGDPPHVTGVRTEQGDLAADLVVDATGRRSSIDRWLEEIGARPAATWWAECGLAYFSRHYRLRPEADLPGLPTTRIVAGLDEFTVGIWGADNGVMQMAVAPLVEDRRFVRLKDPEVFTAVLRTVPTFAAWLGVMDPITPVFPMGGLHNTLRRLVVDGAPVVTGLHAIGDSVCTTNPTFGRGLTMALTGAGDLLNSVNKYGDDWIGQALALDVLVAEHVVPFYEDQAAVDYQRLIMLRHTIFDAPVPNPSPINSARIDYSQLRVAAFFDPTAFRALWDIFGMNRRPDEVYTDRDVITCTLDVLNRHGRGPSVAQPTREQLIAALKAN